MGLNTFQLSEIDSVASLASPPDETEVLDLSGVVSQSQTELVRENKFYWTARSGSYSHMNQNELAAAGADAWKAELLGPIAETASHRDPQTVRVLDIGCGPGIFSILLARAGLSVTAVDYTPQMLVEARRNAGELSERIDWRHMDAQDLELPDDAFDAVVSRNVTWNLPDPERAYREWVRVLKPGGVLVNFDANWYRYLFEKNPLKAAETRKRVGCCGIDGSHIVTDVAAMEQIARQVPLSRAMRPRWDEKVLGGLGMDVRIDREVGGRVWTPDEQRNFSATPLFKVIAVKRG